MAKEKKNKMVFVWVLVALGLAAVIVWYYLGHKNGAKSNFSAEKTDGIEYPNSDWLPGFDENETLTFQGHDFKNIGGAWELIA